MKLERKDKGWMNELVEECADWFGEEMMRLEERDIPNPAGREQRLKEHTVIARANVVMLIDDIFAKIREDRNEDNTHAELSS